MRLLIAGVPRAGKSTLAKAVIGLSRLCWTVLAWDAYKHLRWEEQPNAVLGDLAHVTTPHVVVEGCGASRLLNSGSKQDRVIWTPDRIIHCVRPDLADPRHKGLGVKIERDLEPWKGRKEYIAVDSRIAVASIEAIVRELGTGV